MEIKYNNLYLLIFISFFLTKCNSQSNNSKSLSQKKQEIEVVNFLNKKYFNGCELIIDESNISDHPLFNYIDCKNEGYFSVHFIPNNSELQNYWKSEHYKGIDISNLDIEKDKEKIENKLKNNYNNYSIFSCSLKKEYLLPNSKCNEETIYTKNKSILDIYFYNQNNKQWQKIKSLNTNKLPPYYDNDFFIQNFPQVFKKNSTTNETYKIPNGFYVLQKEKIKLESGEELSIIVLEKDSLKNQNNAQHNSNPIIIFDNKNQKNIVSKNQKIILSYDDNCPADGFGRIISKANFFTIEQIFCQDFLFVKSYITFKIDKNKSILLHKYGEEYTDRSNPNKKIPSKIWTIKDFGNLKFENLSEELIRELRQIEPRK